MLTPWRARQARSNARMSWIFEPVLKESGVFWDPVTIAIVERLLFVGVVLELHGLKAAAAREHQKKNGKEKQGRFHGAEDARHS